jgi:hypothetical protein
MYRERVRVREFQSPSIKHRMEGTMPSISLT